MVWVFLAGAIVSEVFATINLRLSDGFSKVLPTVFVAVGYILAFVLLSQALQRGIAIGVAYGIWAAAGVALVAVLGTVLFGESLTWIQIGGLVAVIGGVVALEVGGAH